MPYGEWTPGRQLAFTETVVGLLAVMAIGYVIVGVMIGILLRDPLLAVAMCAPLTMLIVAVWAARQVYGGRA